MPARSAGYTGETCKIYRPSAMKIGRKSERVWLTRALSPCYSGNVLASNDSLRSATGMLAQRYNWHH
jgi:hypothetical protein